MIETPEKSVGIIRNTHPHALESQYVKFWKGASRALTGHFLPKIISSAKRHFLMPKVDGMRFDSSDMDTEFESIREEMEDWLITDPAERQINDLAESMNRWSAIRMQEQATALRNANSSIPSWTIDAMGEDYESTRQILDDFIDTNTQLLSELGDDLIAEVSEAIKDAMHQGKSVDELADTLEGVAGVNESKAEFWARDQVGSAIGDLNVRRMQETGYPGYTWQTSRDERVRESHAALQGRYFQWGQIPPGLDKPGANRPGSDYQCRCTAAPSFGPHEVKTDSWSEEDHPRDEHGRFGEKGGNQSSAEFKGQIKSYNNEARVLTHELIFGDKKVSDSDIATLTGCPDNGKVVIQTYHNGGTPQNPKPTQASIEIEAGVPGEYELKAQIRRSGGSDPYINVDWMRSRSHGAQSLESMSQLIHKSSELGLSHISTTAAGEGRESAIALFKSSRGIEANELTGYRTWPKLGFDGPMPFKGTVGNSRGLGMTQAEFYRKFPQFDGVKTVVGLHLVAGGEQWWRRFGVNYEAKFDLANGIQSRKIFEGLYGRLKKRH